MSIRFAAAAVLAVLQGASPAAAPLPAGDPVRHLVQVYVKDAATLERLAAMDLDLAACTALEAPVRAVDVIATDEDIRRLRREGFAFEVAIPRLQEHHERELARSGPFPLTLTPPIGQGAMGGHYTLAQIEATMDSFARDYPDLCSVKASIGRSWEGRDIWMVKISSNVSVDDPRKTEILYDSLHHAREPLSAATTLYFMDWLLSGYGKNREATYLLENRQMYFVPVLNPDGYEYNRSIRPGGGGMWRKNRRHISGSTYGVDLNRNWAFMWHAPNGGSSTNPGSATYRGPAPMSEPEVQAMEAFIRTRRFTLGWSVHTYTDVLLRPWGWQYGHPPNASEYDRIAAEAVRHSGVNHGPASNLLYIAAGTALDHYHATHGMYGWTPELGRLDEGGFWPNPENQVRIAQRHVDSFRAVALLGGPALEVVSVEAREFLGNSNGRIDPGETADVVVTVRNRGAVAPASAVRATLRAAGPGVTVLEASSDLGRPIGFSQASNAAAPLRFRVADPFPGRAAAVAVDVELEGVVTTHPLAFVFTGDFRTVVDDDVEADRGFARDVTGDTALSGHWERAAPQAVFHGTALAQPGSDRTPGGAFCWVTDGRAGPPEQHSVDGGRTTLFSPLFDLSHAEAARVRFWLWYYESLQPGDWFEVSVSNDGGGSWTELDGLKETTGGWREMVYPLHGVVPFTDRMRLRFVARDAFASVVEALVDDVTVEAVVGDAALTAWASGARGTAARLGRVGPAGAAGLLLASVGTADLAVPGIEGRLLLDPATVFVVDVAAYPAAGYLPLDLPIPQDPALVGARAHFQLLNVLSATRFLLGNRATVEVR